MSADRAASSSARATNWTPGRRAIATAAARRPGRPNARDLEREAALLDLGQRRQDDRPDERQDPADPRPQAALRVEAARPLGAHWMTLGPLDHRRDRFDAWRGRRRRTAARGRAVRGRARTRADRVVSPNSPIDVEIANSRTSVWPAKSTPSAVASNGPIVKRTVVAGPGEHADEHDRDRDRQRQQERDPERAARATPATRAAGTIVRAMIASGPR